MNTRSLLIVGCLSLLAVLLLAQGDLDPPGPPAPVMKHLDQIEPRTDLASVSGNADAMHLIAEPGSYYLSRNLIVEKNDGIRIESGSVTLDLMGFSIVREDAAPARGRAIAIDVSGASNIAITNGQITGSVNYDPGAGGDKFTGPGFEYGIVATGSRLPHNVRVSHLGVAGCDLDGINLGLVNPGTFADPSPSTLVEHCVVRIVGGDGIRAGEIHHCTALICGGIGVDARGNVSHCRARALGRGINALYSVDACYGFSEGATAISGGTISNSSGVSQGTSFQFADGIAGETVLNCYGRTWGSNGILASSSVSNSTGVAISENSSADGIESGQLISHCHGASNSPGVGLRCVTAVGCVSTGGEAITNKYLMP